MANYRDVDDDKLGEFRKVFRKSASLVKTIFGEFVPGSKFTNKQRNQTEPVKDENGEPVIRDFSDAKLDDHKGIQRSIFSDGSKLADLVNEQTGGYKT